MVRTTKAYDTLLQMGRWFGYREPFAKYCKIYLTQETRNHFNRIRYAVDELYEEVNFMNETDRTPKDFGLKVRNHEQSKLRITAKNKMSGAETIRIAADFSDRFLQAFKILNSNKERNYFSEIENKPNLKIIYLHAKEIIQRMADGTLDLGISGLDLLNESEKNLRDKIIIKNKLNFLAPLNIRGLSIAQNIEFLSKNAYFWPIFEFFLQNYPVKNPLN